MRCEYAYCKYKIKFSTGDCSICNREYCRRHRLKSDHGCEERGKEKHMEEIEKNNPVVEKDKMLRI